MEAIADDSACNFDIDAYRLQEIDFAISAAGAAASESERKPMIEFAQSAIRIGGTWRSAEAMGDYYAHRASSRMRSPGTRPAFPSSRALRPVRPRRTANSCSPAPRRPSIRRATTAKGGIRRRSRPRHATLTAASAASTRRELLRGAQAVAVPLPINFFFDETRFTPVGEQAIEELLEAVKQQNVDAMVLVGHTDPRGDHNYNVDLSKRRAAAVRDYLLSHGVSAHIDVDGKGPDSPFDVSLLGRPVTKEEEWALDRRVEWVRQGSPD